MRVVYAQNVGLNPNLEGDVGLVLTQGRAQRFNVVLRQAPAIKFLAVVPENDGQWSQLKSASIAPMPLPNSLASPALTVTSLNDPSPRLRNSESGSGRKLDGPQCSDPPSAVGHT